MNASGVLPQEYGPTAVSSAGGGALGRRGSGRVRTLSASGSRLELDDSWVTTSPAFTELQDRSIEFCYCFVVCMCYQFITGIFTILQCGADDDLMSGDAEALHTFS